MSATTLHTAAKQLVKLSAGLTDSGLNNLSRILACTHVFVALETINTKMNMDPYPVLFKALNNANSMLSLSESISHEIDESRNISNHTEVGVNHTIDLFENAWTTYSSATYDHSVELVKTRLNNSGFNEAWFAGKKCFDGGCGTGRLAIAMAQMGAKEVTAVDLGNDSLDYLRKVINRYNLTNIKVVNHDITELSSWASNEFDFVASNGVLHHTEACDRGIIEHYRITKPDGIFWVYLYGAGGLYWQMYDALKGIVINISPKEIRKTLHGLGFREGMIYTYLDNFLAPRVYYSRDSFLKLLVDQGEYSWRHAKGSSEIDDTEILLNTSYGKQIYGPQGEVRLILTKKSITTQTKS